MSQEQSQVYSKLTSISNLNIKKSFFVITRITILILHTRISAYTFMFLSSDNKSRVKQRFRRIRDNIILDDRSEVYSRRASR